MRKEQFKRVVLFHFHLFKNAGTSIDKILLKNFGEKFTQREFAFDPYEENIQEVIRWIEDEKDKIAFSSHTARLFDLNILKQKHVLVLPIIFLRHPLIRIHSAYYFEKEIQKNLNTLEVVIARNTSLKGYIEIRWALPNDHQCNNFHISRLSDMYYYEQSSNYEKALKALQTLPFVGLVEKFEVSLKRLKEIIEPYFPHFEIYNVAENVQFNLNYSIEERLMKIKEEVGEEFYETLIYKNKEDIELWNKVKALYEYNEYEI